MCMGLAGAGRIFKLLQRKTEKNFAVKHEKNTYEIRLNFSWIGDTIKWKRRGLISEGKAFFGKNVGGDLRIILPIINMRGG